MTKTHQQILTAFVQKYSAYTYDPNQPLYHGTPKEFETLKLASNGMLWLTPSREAAIEYSDKRWEKGPSRYLWTVKLKPNVKILNLGDLNNKYIREIYKGVSDHRSFTFGAIEEADWPKFADFGLLEYHYWIVKFLKSKKIDGATCSDRAGGRVDHDSIALLRLPAIESATKEKL